MLLFICFGIPTIIVLVLSFFISEDCLPKKRLFHNMLDDIEIYQRLYNDGKDIEFSHKGKTFKVRVEEYRENYSYKHYDVYINDEKVFVYHILDHCFSKSRERCDCGDRLSNEVDEILFAARKYANKTKYGSWDAKHNSKSYF